MASARDLKKKIRSISNTRKITRTMELVATSKAKRAQDRLNATTPYAVRLAELLNHLAQAGTIRHPLLEKPALARPRTALVLISANRGFSGGYNANVLNLSEQVRKQEIQEQRDVDLYVFGRKALQRLRFLKITPYQSFTHIDDRPSFKDAAALADELMGRFLRGEVDRVSIVSTRYLSAGTQVARLSALLPIEPPKSAAPKPGEEKASARRRQVEYIFEPDPKSILEVLLPLSVTNAVYRLLVEAAVSEQIARRMAMKRATDNAGEMIDIYRQLYNRSRQASITQQINEIVSGASALE